MKKVSVLGINSFLDQFSDTPIFQVIFILLKGKGTDIYRKICSAAELRLHTVTFSPMKIR